MRMQFCDDCGDLLNECLDEKVKCNVCGKFSKSQLVPPPPPLFLLQLFFFFLFIAKKNIYKKLYNSATILIFFSSLLIHKKKKNRHNVFKINNNNHRQFPIRSSKKIDVECTSCDIKGYGECADKEGLSEMCCDGDDLVGGSVEECG